MGCILALMRPEIRKAIDHLKELKPTPEEGREIQLELAKAGILVDFRKLGLEGGRKLKRERGPDYYRRIGKLGGRPPKKKRGK